MADYRKVHVSLWNDDTFPFMSDDGKLVVLHLMTGPYSNPIGLYKCSLGALADELRWDLERYRTAFQEAEDAGFVEYDPVLLVVYLPRFLAENPPANPNVLAGWVKKWEELPRSRLKLAFLQELEARLSEFGARDDLPSQRTGFIEAFERKWRPHCVAPEARESAVRAPAVPAPVPAACSAIRDIQVETPEVDLPVAAPVVVRPAPVRKHAKIRTDYSPEFQRFWQAYPTGRAVSKPQCYLVWRAHALDERCEEVCAKIERLKLTTWKDKDPKFIVTAPVWLNQGRWEDDLVPVEAGPAPRLTGPRADALACIAHYEERHDGASGLSGFHRPAAALGGTVLPVSSGQVGLDHHAARVF